MRISVGDRVGNYHLRAEVAHGSFSVVFRAEDIRDGKQVAIKFPNVEKAEQNAVLQEAFLWARVSHHPNVLTVHSVELHDERIVIISDFASDGTLRDWLNRHGGKAIFPEPAVALIQGILSGLAYLHQQGIVHRDLKPENIAMFGDTPRLMDFGLARNLHASMQVSQPIGTPLYMPPEQYEGKVSREGDQWSAGVIAYELLCGHLPFPAAGDPYMQLYRVKTELPQPMPASVPPYLQKAILRSLEKERTDRFPSIEAFLQALEPPSPVPSVRRQPKSPALTPFLGLVTVIAAGAAISFYRQPERPIPVHPTTAPTPGRREGRQQNAEGWRYVTGEGVPRDIDRAVALFKQSAESGDPDGECSLAWAYDTGRGVKRDLTVAALWYQKAADQGHAAAQCHLGWMYLEGQGVTRDPAKAVQLIRLSAEKGNDRGQFSLGWLYERGRGVLPDRTEAVRWYRRAAAQGNPDARKRLATLVL